MFWFNFVFNFKSIAQSQYNKQIEAQLIFVPLCKVAFKAPLIILGNLQKDIEKHRPSGY